MLANLKDRIISQKFFFIPKTLLFAFNVLVGFIMFIFAFIQLFQKHPFSETILVFPNFAFGIVGIVAYVFSLFSNTVGGIIHLCNSILVFSHFWIILNLLGRDHWVWIGIVVLEVLFGIASDIIAVLDLVVACRQEKDSESYTIQTDEQ